MKSKTRENSRQFLDCYWPQEFKSRRSFPRQRENEPFIEYCQRRQFPRQIEDQPFIKQLNKLPGESADGGSVEGSDACEDNLDEDDEPEVDDFEDDSEDDEDDDGEGEEEGQYGDSKKEKEELQRAQLWKSRSPIRKLMEGFEGDEEALPYPDQVEKVVGFCEQGSSTGSKIHVALLHDANNGGPSSKKGPYCRPYKGPLTSQKFRDELEKQRFRIKSNEDTPPLRFNYQRDDAERRVVLQAPAIRNMLYKNLTGKPAIGASISTEDLPVFSLEFHIPYFIPKRSGHSITDFRKTADGQPLRRSWELPVPLRPMITSTPAVGQVWLCENQTSIVVTGIDHWVWTAYGIVDTYIGSKESLMHYDEQSDQSGQVDPLSKGQLHAHPLTLIWTPREYFLAIVAIRMNEALRAWRETINVVEDIVKQARTNHVISKPSDDASRQAALNYSNWCNQLIQLLKLLINSLSDTVATWDEFQRGEIGYFDDGEAKSPLTKSMFIVKKKFSDLKEILRKLRDLELQLCADSPQGLHAHLGFGNQDVAIAQQRDAYRMQVFTVVAMVSVMDA
ncbi:hypothetical protein NA56DRAFT_664794 [Hyaloscypha hepaticicola]|uniref:Uncharacterized protein n=1 Tax=Hyaloscypha hepaticicola TaxID=2082293 RepID=A0A2J6PJM5_9HELO|nr:hypothetical protein NA56DRAFT_664794 [Hyaloscypha hepaticicola]